MDDVEALFQNAPERRLLEERAPRLLRRQRREPPEGALEPVRGHVRVIVVAALRLPARRRAVRVFAVDHVDPVPAAPELVRQPVDEYAVAAEAVRRIEGRHHAKAQRPVGHPRLRSTARRTARGMLRALTYQGKMPESMSSN